ncbi:hypothetical protein [Denitromonas halophila]|uniref:Uncharacterized protein n=1 Tax=Denitromonas halophila TaxID=1629404 RepID=A0A557QKI2_9RHOO|nr:hypothetical protein [Denitromonas halophila]TVO53416.1 hypothetical protein FHP91_16735 [Denitromonas halophila]
MTTTCFKSLSALALVALLAGQAHAATPRTETCEQIRARIQAQVGDRAKPDTTMLDTLSEHPDCAFTAAEVFRAAFGDRPMPVQTHRRDRRDRNDDDD